MSARRGGSRKRGADEIEAECSTSKDPWATTSFTWRIENFSKLSSDSFWSYCFEAGICTWRLRLFPKGTNAASGTHLSAFLEAQDMWVPTAEHTLTVVNKVDSKSRKARYTDTFDFGHGWGKTKFVELSALRGAASGWLVSDTLVIKVDVTMERESRFQLDTGDMPYDVVLKLPCEDVLGGAPIPVDGSFGTWIYILSDLYPLHDPPALTLGSVLTMLPVVHKYNFTKLLTRLVVFVKENLGRLGHEPHKSTTYAIRWLALAELLQLDELRELVSAG
ncbi:hypothetical protein FOA52_013561 [Chlamydomonas sp. UWO 241]|nr:hypothetical protein FOA52_013561 [Chlamydomonas sp. UWO 241]